MQKFLPNRSFILSALQNCHFLDVSESSIFYEGVFNSEESFDMFHTGIGCKIPAISHLFGNELKECVSLNDVTNG